MTPEDVDLLDDLDACPDNAFTREAREQYGLLPTKSSVVSGRVRDAVFSLRRAAKDVIQATLTVIKAHRTANGPISPQLIEQTLGRVFTAVYHPIATLYPDLGATDSEERSVVLCRITGEVEQALGLVDGTLDYYAAWDVLVDTEVAAKRPKPVERPFVVSRGLAMPEDQGCVVDHPIRHRDIDYKTHGAYWWHPPIEGRTEALCDILRPTDEQAVAITAAAESNETDVMGRVADANVALHDFRLEREAVTHHDRPHRST